MWATWSTWGDCNFPCNTGFMARFRDCVSMVDGSVASLDDCKGQHSQAHVCNTHICLDPGEVLLRNKLVNNVQIIVEFVTEWTPWYSWHTCSVPCGGGLMSRERGCTYDGDPVPISDCTGRWTEANVECNTHSCEPPIPCPAPHFFAFNANESCCTNYYRKYDPETDPAFDGGVLLPNDLLNMCSDFIQCPNVPPPKYSTCFHNPEGDGK